MPPRIPPGRTFIKAKEEGEPPSVYPKTFKEANAKEVGILPPQFTDKHLKTKAPRQSEMPITHNLDKSKMSTTKSRPKTADKSSVVQSSKVSAASPRSQSRHLTQESDESPDKQSRELPKNASQGAYQVSGTRSHIASQRTDSWAQLKKPCPVH